MPVTITSDLSDDHEGHIIKADMKEVLSHVFMQVWFVLHEFVLFLFLFLAANMSQVLWSELGGVIPVFLHSTFC